jgi:hypothetical protein
MSIPDENTPIDGAAQRMTLLEKLRQGKRGIGPNRGSEQVTTSRAPEHGQHRMATADEEVLLDHAALEPMTKSGFRGPRGRRVEGYPGLTETQAGGMPPVLAPFQPVDVLPKDARLPKIPGQYHYIQDSIASGVTKGTLIGDHDVGFPINSYRVNNWSVFWIKVSQQWVPPLTVGMSWPEPDSSSKLRIVADTPPGAGFTTLNGGGTAAAGVIEVHCYECLEVGIPNPGAVLKLPAQP